MIFWIGEARLIRKKARKIKYWKDVGGIWRESTKTLKNQEEVPGKGRSYLVGKAEKAIFLQYEIKIPIVQNAPSLLGKQKRAIKIKNGKFNIFRFDFLCMLCTKNEKRITKNYSEAIKGNIDKMMDKKSIEKQIRSAILKAQGSAVAGPESKIWEVHYEKGT